MKKISILIGLAVFNLTTAHDCVYIGGIDIHEHHYLTKGYAPELIIDRELKELRYRGGWLQYKLKITDRRWRCYPDFHAPIDGWHRLTINYPEGSAWSYMFFRLVPF